MHRDIGREPCGERYKKAGIGRRAGGRQKPVGIGGVIERD